MKAIPRQEAVKKSYIALKSGKLNEAFKIASSGIPFYAEDKDFIGLLGHSLDLLGFKEESESILNFLEKLKDYSKSHSHNIIESKRNSKIEGFSVQYKKSGTHDSWDGPLWEIRARYLSRYLQNADRVLDLGCGNMLIEKYLPENTSYVPCDIERRDDRTIVCNFDEMQYPQDQGETQIICIGVLNYLSQPVELVKHICSRGKPFLLSYKPKEFIQHKINDHIFPDTLRLSETANLIESQNYSCSFHFLLGQGDETLVIANPRQA